MNDKTDELPTSDAQNLKQCIQQLISQNDCQELSLLLSKSETQSNLEIISTDLYAEVCLVHLTRETHETNLPLYLCIEELLKAIARHGPRDELMLEIMALIEESATDYIFTTGLRALQIILLRHNKRKPRALQWALNSVYTRLQDIPRPAILSTLYEPKERALLEQDADMQALFVFYVTVGLFYKPLLQETLNKEITEISSDSQLFNKGKCSQRNVYCCFFIKLLGEPLSLMHLDLTPTEKGSNSYTIQVVGDLIDAIAQCQSADLFYLLQLVEARVRWRRVLDRRRGVYECSSLNVFLVEDYVPLQGLAILYYMLIVEYDCLVSRKFNIPVVYHPLFIYESTLYLVLNLLEDPKPLLQERGLLLVQKVLSYLSERGIRVPAAVLESELHKSFCHKLTHIMSYATEVIIRRLATVLLRQYVMQFDNEGKYYVIMGMLSIITHPSLIGHLLSMYREILMSAINASDGVLPAIFGDENFRGMLFDFICRLPNDVETDLIENKDHIIASLNFLRFFALYDKHNITGFRKYIDEIEKNYLVPLDKALYFSISHYKEELNNNVDLDNAEVVEREKEQLKMLTVAVNNKMCSMVDDLKIDKNQKISLLNEHLCCLDLIQSLLVRTNECITIYRAVNC